MAAWVMSPCPWPRGSPCCGEVRTPQQEGPSWGIQSLGGSAKGCCMVQGPPWGQTALACASLQVCPHVRVKCPDPVSAKSQCLCHWCLRCPWACHLALLPGGDMCNQAKHNQLGWGTRGVLDLSLPLSPSPASGWLHQPHGHRAPIDGIDGWSSELFLTVCPHPSGTCSSPGANSGRVET